MFSVEIKSRKEICLLAKLVVKGDVVAVAAKVYFFAALANSWNQKRHNKNFE